MMSEWRTDSEVSAINHAAGRASVAISDELFTCLSRAQALSRQTQGAFDVTWAALRGLWTFDSAAKVPADDQILEALSRVGYQRLVLDAKGRTAALKSPGMVIGLGAIAKGYGIDRAAYILSKRGIKNFILDGGGDLYFGGEKEPGVPWTVGVRHPRHPEQIIVDLPIRDAAVVSSGDYERFFERDGVRYHHILDLRTGKPARKSVAVTVRATNATVADAVATALFVLGPKAGLDLAAQYPGLDAAIFTPDGRLHTTPEFRASFPLRWDAK